MKLLIDHQLPVQLAAHLRSRGHDCEHVFDIGLNNVTDSTIWSHALQRGQIVVSKDEDFVYLANRPGDTGRLLWVRLGNCRNIALFASFDSLDAAITKAFESGQRIVEVR